MKICTKRFYIFTSTCNYILYKIQIFIKIKFYKIEWICKICNETFVTIFTMYEFYLLCEKDFGVSYFDEKKLSCILWTRKLIWRWMEKKEKKKKSEKKIKRRARTVFFFFQEYKKKRGKNLHIMSRDNKNAENNGTDFCKLLCAEILLSSYV